MDNGLDPCRPVDMAVLKDRSLLVSDDVTGAAYRIFYAAPCAHGAVIGTSAWQARRRWPCG